LWERLNDKSRVLKFSVEEIYYDGSSLIEKDAEDVIFPELSMRLFV